jgi:hypothetical protein
MRTPLDLVTQIHDMIQLCLDELGIDTPPPALPGDELGILLMGFLLDWAALHLRDREATLGQSTGAALLDPSDE